MSFASFIKRNIHNSNLGFWLITIALFIGLIVPVLIREGMFMDGQQYAVVAKNLATGKGSFWFPVLSDTWWKAGSSNFMEHPPLVYGLQSVFFNLFNNSIYSERIYAFLTAVFHLLLIIKIRNQFDYNKKQAWFAILLFLIMPVTTWSFQNNILENTLSVFTLASVLFVIKSVRNTKYQYVFSAFAGIFVFLAFLSKGLPGLFPLSVGLFYFLLFKPVKHKQFILSQIVFFTIPLLLFLVLFLIPTSAESLTFYLKDRLLFRLNNEPTVGNQLFILKSLCLQIALPVFVAFMLNVIAKIRINSENKRIVLLFFLIGASASLPLMLTSVQRSFYLLPALPFYALALAFLSHNSLERLIQHIKHSSTIVISGATLLLLALIISIASIGKYSRDKDMILDVKNIGEIIPNGSTISISQAIYQEWNLQMYLLRYYDISVKPECNKSLYYLSDKTDTQINSKSKELLEINLNKYLLFKVKND